MFDVGFFELCIIGIVALLVIGPERLPRAARTAGLWIGRAKRMVSQVKSDIDDELRREELKEFQEAKESLTQAKEQLDSFKGDLDKQAAADVETDDQSKSSDIQNKPKKKPSKKSVKSSTKSSSTNPTKSTAESS